MKFPPSQLAHKILDGLEGIEIGGSAHNDFEIPGCKNVDYTADHTGFSEEQIRLCGKVMPVDIVADAAHLPLADESQDYVLSSHQLEHSWDTIGAIEEWVRVLRPASTRNYPWSGDPVPEMGGFLYIVLPHRSPHEVNEPTTTLEELISRHLGTSPPPQDYLENNRSAHRCFWSAQHFLRKIVPYLCSNYSLQLYAFETHDCRVGNGFTVVLQKVASNG